MCRPPVVDPLADGRKPRQSPFQIIGLSEDVRNNIADIVSDTIKVWR